VNLTSLSTFPENAADRDRWITERRGPREPVNADRPYAFLAEEERFSDGSVGSVATVFLTNRECPWRCTMCDLWCHTVTYPVAPGAIPQQIEYALSRLPGSRQIKLYNSGSFFDRHAIPTEDYDPIAKQVSLFERVIVESHPTLIAANCWRFRQLLLQQNPEIRLEVAMGLETAHPEVLSRLNKRMTIEQYAAAAEQLRSNDVDLRAFILIQPPFMLPEEALFWACRSIDFAFDCGATAVSLIPTRAGNGALDELASQGQFSPPSLRTIEESQDYGVTLSKGRVFVDLWDISRIARCATCHGARIERMRNVNLFQTALGRISCADCEENA
jgi:archaeosine synthase beta-subunit